MSDRGRFFDGVFSVEFDVEMLFILLTPISRDLDGMGEKRVKNLVSNVFDFTSLKKR